MFGLDLAIARQVKFSSAVGTLTSALWRGAGAVGCAACWDTGSRRGVLVDLDAVQKSGPQIVKDTYYLKNVLKDQAYLQYVLSMRVAVAVLRPVCLTWRCTGD